MKFLKWLAGVVTAVATVLFIIHFVEEKQEESYISME